MPVEKSVEPLMSYSNTVVGKSLPYNTNGAWTGGDGAAFLSGPVVVIANRDNSDCQTLSQTEGIC
jgi:hypothetical protein